MKVHLRLFFQWGICFDEEHPYAVPEHGNRKVTYADKIEIMNAILEKYPPIEPEGCLEKMTPRSNRKMEEPCNTWETNTEPRKKPGGRNGAELKTMRHDKRDREMMGDD